MRKLIKNCKFEKKIQKFCYKKGRKQNKIYEKKARNFIKIKRKKMDKKNNSKKAESQKIFLKNK